MKRIFMMYHLNRALFNVSCIIIHLLVKAQLGLPRSTDCLQRRLHFPSSWASSTLRSLFLLSSFTVSSHIFFGLPRFVFTTFSFRALFLLRCPCPFFRDSPANAVGVSSSAPRCLRRPCFLSTQCSVPCPGASSQTSILSFAFLPFVTHHTFYGRLV